MNWNFNLSGTDNCVAPLGLESFSPAYPGLTHLGYLLPPRKAGLERRVNYIEPVLIRLNVDKENHSRATLAVYIPASA